MRPKLAAGPESPPPGVRSSLDPRPSFERASDQRCHGVRSARDFKDAGSAMPIASPVTPIPAHSLLVFLLQAGLLLVLALLLGRLATRFGLPAVVGELCVGVILGPTVLHHLSSGL